MKEIFGLVVLLICLTVACNTRPKETIVIDSDSTEIANERNSHQRYNDSLKLFRDSMDVLIKETIKTLDSLIVVNRTSKSKKLDSLIRVEKEKYKSYQEKREESMILD